MKMMEKDKRERSKKEKKSEGSLMCNTHLVGIHDGPQETFSLTSQSGAQTLWAADQQADHKVCILLNTLTCKQWYVKPHEIKSWAAMHF